jgi:2,4-dienoyl-CoA reductase-like NADH-dependent reductase (Old Yellow Enzyme family)
VTQHLQHPLALATTTLANRLAKSATSEALADRSTGQPTEALVRLYERWGAGGAGLLITGNVVFDLDARTEPGVVVIRDERDLPMLRRWAAAAQAHGARAVMQINHAGRQTPKRIARTPVAPSAVTVAGKGGLFGRPRALTERELGELVEGFARTAQIAMAAGFAGVQLHAAHGYLINQFLSPLSNRRTDGWGGELDGRMRFLREVVRAVRARIGSAMLAVKLNSADFQRGGFDEAESMKVVAALEAERIDLLEISGGNYERSAMMGGERTSTQRREAYFLDYAREVRRTTKLPLMLTGGLRTAAMMDDVVGGGDVDVVGMARPLVVEPDLPARLLRGDATGALEIMPRIGIRMFDDVLQIAWYQRQLRRIAAGRDPDPRLGRWSSVVIGIARNYAFNPLGRRGGRTLAEPSLLPSASEGG